jgi:hypothetical protein
MAQARDIPETQGVANAIYACDSSLLKAAAYHDPAAVLELAFHSGAIYCYFAVPAQIYREFLRAESKGRYFNSHIRNRFNFIKLRDAG